MERTSANETSGQKLHASAALWYAVSVAVQVSQRERVTPPVEGVGLAQLTAFVTSVPIFASSARLTAQVPQLLGVADRTDRLHDVVGDVQRDRDERLILAVEEHRARLTVDVHEAHSDHTASFAAGPSADEQVGDVVPSVDRT